MQPGVDHEPARAKQFVVELTQPAHEITLGTVIRLLDGEPGPPAPAAPADPLATRLRGLWDEANQAGLRLLDGVTLAELVAVR